LQRGYSLINVILLSALITILATALLNITRVNVRTSHASLAFQLAEKAANAGYTRAAKEIKERGFCNISGSLTGSVGDAQYEVSVKRSGRICFIKSVGTYRRARVVKTGIVQAFYGVGLYTVRGNVDAELYRGVRLSGCDYTEDPVCVVPAFIVSGRINTGIEPQRCCSNDDAGVVGCTYSESCDPADGGGPGLYGNPAIVEGVEFTDLIPLFFNVNCFNAYGGVCDEGLLQIFEREYGEDLMSFNNDWGVPTLSLSQLTPTVSSDCIVQDKMVDLEDYEDCSTLVLSNLSGLIRIEGHRDTPLELYFLRQEGNDNAVLLLGTPLPSGSALYSHFPLLLSSSPSCRDFYTSSSQGSELYRFLLNEANETANCFSLGEDSDSLRLEGVRIFTTADVFTDDDGFTFDNSILVIAPEDPQELNDTTPYTYSWFRLRPRGDLVVRNSALFVAHTRFADGELVRLLDTLLYTYAYACPDCSRNSSTSSLDACRDDLNRCGWFGRRVNLLIGRGAGGAERPSLIISNNTSVYIDSPRRTVYIWGAFVGQDVTYLLWRNTNEQDYRGFLVRNFPPDLTLRIRIGDGFSLEFRKSLLDALTQNFWFFRKVNCIRDDTSLETQLVQTRSITY